MARHLIQPLFPETVPETGLVQRFADAMSALGPFEAAPHLAVALSGGADSLALAVLARDWAAARGGKVSALVVDHGLRPGSSAEAKAATAQALSLDIPAQILTWDGEKPAAAVQAAAREARYGLLRGWCRKAGVLHLLAGHHADDQCETHLMRVGRGGGLGAAGMSALREFPDVRLLRPLLGVGRADLAAFLRSRGLDWIEDPSNVNEAFERVRWRRRLADEAGLAASAQAGLVQAGQERLLAERAAASAMAQAVSLRPLGFAQLDRDAFRGLPAKVAALIVGRLVQTLGGTAHAPPPARSDRLAARIAGAGYFPGASLGRCRFLAEKAGGIVVCRDRRGLPDPVAARPGRIENWDGRFRIDFADDLPGGTVLAPLGPAGWRQIAKPVRKACGVPPPAAHGLPALFKDGVLVAHALGGGAGGALILRFRPKNSLAFNGFCIA